MTRLILLNFVDRSVQRRTLGILDFKTDGSVAMPYLLSRPHWEAPLHSIDSYLSIACE
jgi:hypothetical protein